MTEREAQYREIAKLFSAALNQHRLYAENHPLAQASVQNLHTLFSQSLRSQERLTLATKDKHFLVNGSPLELKATGVTALMEEFVARQVESLSFERDLTYEELRGLLKLMALPAKSAGAAGGFQKQFDQQRFRHIRLGAVHYQEVGEGEVPEIRAEETQPDRIEEKREASFSVFEAEEAVEEKEAYEGRARSEELERIGKDLGIPDWLPRGPWLRRLLERIEEEVSRKVDEKVAPVQRELGVVRNEKERVDAIIRNMGEGVVVVDHEGKIQLMNPAAEKLLGMSLRDARGIVLASVLKAEHLLALAKGPLKDQPDHVTKEIEVKSIDDHTRKILQASTAIIENQAGKTVGMVSVLSDITRQKEIEEMKSAFVAHVSHELRTPLFAIEQSLALLLEKEKAHLSANEEQFLAIAHRNIIRLSRLVDDLLDVAKLEAGQMRLRKTCFSIGDLVRHTVETVRGWAGTNALTIEERYPQSDLEVEADPDRITQVVTNLLSNALKFTPPGGKILVELDTDYRDPANSRPWVAVSVEDTGIGIAKEDQERIFEKFEQVSLVAPKGVSSTGLGLTIAKEIVELHGGKIWVESDPGKGSRFTFIIPKDSGASEEERDLSR